MSGESATESPERGTQRERGREKQKGTITKAVNGTSPYRAKRNMEEDTEACSPSFESDCSVCGSAPALSAHLCLSKSEKAEKAEAKSESERRARGAVEHHGADGGGTKKPRSRGSPSDPWHTPQMRATSPSLSSSECSFSAVT